MLNISQSYAKNKLAYLGLALLPLIFIFFALLIGRFPVPLAAIGEVLRAKLTHEASALPIQYQTVVWEIRLPRAILGALVGGSLAVSGAAFQGLFRNPLVSAGILGVSAGPVSALPWPLLLFNSVILNSLLPLYSARWRCCSACWSDRSMRQPRR